MAIKDDMEDVQEAVINELITDNGLNPLTVGDGEITTAKIADGAVTPAKLAVSFAPAQGSLSTGQFADDAVTRPKIADDAVTTAKIDDGAVTPAKLSQSYLPLTGGSVSGNVNFGDNDKAVFGASSDLNIYHDGSNSDVQDSGDGQLRIDTNGTDVRITKTDSEYMAKFIVDAGVELYHNNIKKVETTSAGLLLSGTNPNITLTGDSNSYYPSIHMTGLHGGLGFGTYFGGNISGNSISFRTGANTPDGGTERMRIDSQGRIILANVPTSSSGLSTGTIYSDGGTLKIV